MIGGDTQTKKPESSMEGTIREYEWKKEGGCKKGLRAIVDMGWFRKPYWAIAAQTRDPVREIALKKKSCLACP